jgi:hypothetical protein
MAERARRETGAALMLVLLGILVFVATGTFIIMAVDRNTDLRFAFQRSLVGFHSAEAGIHKGAVEVQNQMLNFQLPTNCGAGGTSFNINGRTVTYYLSVPPGLPYSGVAGSCTETPQAITEAAGPYAGLNALLYAYNLTSKAKNPLGFVESTINNQFQAHLIPMFQFNAFYADDLELLPGPTAIFNGRIHTNKNLYLNSDSCGAAPGSGLNILGRITIAGSGTLNRGRKDNLTVNWNNVYISTDGTTGGLQVLGTNAPGSASCTQTATRQIGSSEVATFNNRVTTGIPNISLPTPPGLLCVPWITGCGTTGAYWQNANLRIALDTTQLVNTDAGPTSQIYAIEVLNADGSVNAGATTSLQTFMAARPGAITYSDVPASGWNCDTAHGGLATCETVYADGTQYTKSGIGTYAPTFPAATGAADCTLARTPRDQITATNYCGDYRYGGFFSWREHKPLLMLNIDWMAFEEYNNANGDLFFNHTVTTNNGLIVFFTVKDTACGTGCEGLAADNYAVRIYDAGRARRNTLDPGVTFATDRSMYVAGNFNCPQPTLGAGSTPATCGDASWPPTGASTYQKGTSLVGDTVNVQSCNWVAAPAGNDPCGSFSMDVDQWAAVCGTVSGASQCRPADEASTVQSGTILGPGFVNGAVACGGNGCAARNTVIDAGFLANADQTWCSLSPTGSNCGTSNYDGGLENYPRFHEDWSATGGFWYQGSFVEIGTPQHTCWKFNSVGGIGNDPTYPCNAYPLQGFWSTQRYSPPPRHWFYDVSFNNAAYLPPLTPRFVYLSLVFFTQVYQ